MDRTMKEKIAEAIGILQWKKGRMMEAVYGKGYRGIDSALPQDYVDANGLSYGNEDIDKNLFYFVTNYNGSTGTIEHMLDKLLPIKAAAILLLADTYVKIVKASTEYINAGKDYKPEYERYATIADHFKAIIYSRLL